MAVMEVWIMDVFVAQWFMAMQMRMGLGGICIMCMGVVFIVAVAVIMF